MIILTQKIPIWFVLVFIYLFSTPILSQNDFLNSTCETAANYTRNSTFEKNLNTTLSILPNTNSGFGFFNYSTGQGIDTVNSIAICQGDVNPDVCQRCLNDSIVKARKDCPNQKEATVYYKQCLLKYSNQTILGKDQPKPYHFELEDDRFSSDKDSFNTAIRPLLKNLTATAAAGDSRLKFATGETSGINSETIYGLVQCTPDLISKQCSDCLIDIIDQFSISDSRRSRVGGATLLPTCYFRNKFKQETDFDEIETMDIGAAESLRYTFSLIKAATNDFSETNKLGQGGFGAVYKDVTISFNKVV
ncbi:cysteine-rich RLK (RECEPTOR-like protein kinase) 10 [Artemisia annua]|uniref:Cysteine-rich RLK (RECEPTOR-like protein kinase) 10 n=1 Tax=Artemisia annua TaxID=35608 RepID=A0A2U1M6R3_ARTAN|nr:cysteine-rich RLK (RECEPTOR-like protein kinase) 10 [Artemisia annua]